MTNQMEYTTERKLEILAEGKCRGYQFYIISYGTHPCAYIEIPIDHPLYHEYPKEIIVHGGISWIEDYLYEIIENSWVIGWDYTHGMDFNARLNTEVYCHKYTVEEIFKDVLSVTEQLEVMKYEERK